MKILLYGINFAPELTGIGKYTGELAAWLAARGHQVRVVTAPPYYPDWKVGAGFKNGWAVEDIRGEGAAPTNTVPPAPVGAAPPLRLTPELVFVFCGKGAGRADLVARCQGLPNVQFMDLQPANRLPDLLATADIHLLPQRADAADLVMPSKLTGMLASARPVVATAAAGTELAAVVGGEAQSMTACGLVVPPEDAVAFASAVQTLAFDAPLREQLGAAGYLYAQAHLDRDAVLEKFEAELLALVGK